MLGRGDQRVLSRSVGLLWLISAAVIGMASWIGGPVSGLFHYGVSIAAWFAGFGVAYVILDATAVKFSRFGAFLHFGLVSVGATSVVVPLVVLQAVEDPTAPPEMIARFRTLSAVTTTGYGLILVGFAVFIGLLVHAVWHAAKNRDQY